MMIEEASDRDSMFVVGSALFVDSCDAIVDLSCGSCDSFEHSVTAEGVKVGTRESKRQMAGDAR